MSTSSIAAIILAAGRSTRMSEGYHKLLLPLGNESVLAHVVAATLASQARPVVVVVGYRANEIQASLKEYAPSLIVIENPQYREGMSTSIHAGIRALQTSPTFKTIDGTLIVLGDQPLITPQLLNSLIDTKRHTHKRIVASLYNRKRISPTLFDTSLFPELLAITGDEGGRAVLQRHSQEMATVEHVNESASYDIDTWEAYQQVVAEWQRNQGKENM